MRVPRALSLFEHRIAMAYRGIDSARGVECYLVFPPRHETRKNYPTGLKITPIAGAWIALISGDKIYLRWRDEVILVLRRIGVNAAISTSFDCAKASGKTELAICDSRELAGFDRSISQAYKHHLNNAKNLDLSDANIACDQRLWIRKKTSLVGQRLERV